MTKNFNMQDAEKQVFRLATFKDGLWEIYLGLFFTLMSIYSITRELLGPVINAIFILGMLLLLVGGVWIAKRSITLPRIGHVKFGKNTHKNIRNANIVTWGLVIATFALLILSAQNWINEPTWKNLPQWLTDFDVDLVFALVILALFSLVAYSIKLPRFYLYGILLGAGNFISAVLLVYQAIEFQWPLAIAGITITMMGSWVLSKFLRDYPISTGEAANAG